MIVEAILKLIKGIVNICLEVTKRFIQGIIYMFIVHTKGMIVAIISFLAMLTQVHQSKYGIFICYKDTIINNKFNKVNKVEIVTKQGEIEEKVYNAEENTNNNKK